MYVSMIANRSTWYKNECHGNYRFSVLLLPPSSSRENTFPFVKSRPVSCSRRHYRLSFPLSFPPSPFCLVGDRVRAMKSGVAEMMKILGCVLDVGNFLDRQPKCLSSLLLFLINCPFEPSVVFKQNCVLVASSLRDTSHGTFEIFRVRIGVTGTTLRINMNQHISTGHGNPWRMT